MRDTLHPFFRITLSVLISVVVWTVTAMALMSLPSKLTGGGFLIPNMSFSESAKWGLIIGFVHGLLMAFTIYWNRTESVVGTSLSSVVLTEILIVVGFIAGLISYFTNRPIHGGQPRIIATYEDLYILVANVILWFLVISVLLLVPSIVVGIGNRLLTISPRYSTA